MKQIVGTISGVETYADSSGKREFRVSAELNEEAERQGVGKAGWTVDFVFPETFWVDRHTVLQLDAGNIGTLIGKPLVVDDLRPRK